MAEAARMVAVNECILKVAVWRSVLIKFAVKEWIGRKGISDGFVGEN